MLDPVYRAWGQGRQATLLSLDIKGAYDRVDRGKLLETLISKKIPDWIVNFVWSFLSTRSTTLEMPGHHPQGPFYVNIGIPQGSTLSPILFLFFASPLLSRLSQSSLQSTLLVSDETSLAYVDDTYLLVISESHKRNCRQLERLHGTLMEWATESGVIFEPSKYAVMHFRNPERRIGQDYCELPRIPDLTRDNLKTEMRVLGIIVDAKLKWQRHVEHVSVMTRRIALNSLTLLDCS